LGLCLFLTEEDAGYSAYRLDGHRYKDYDLNATESNPKGNQNARNNNNNARNAPRGAPGNNNNNNNNNPNNPNSKQPKKKKAMYSLRTLTPHNPPTMNQTPMLPVKPPVVPNTIREDEQVSNTKFSQGQNENQVHQSPIAGQNAEAGQTNTNNYPRNNRRRNNNNQDQGQKRSNNNRNQRSRGEFRPVQQKRQSDIQSENNVNEDAKQDTSSSTPNPSPQVDNKSSGQNNNRSQTNKPNQSQGNRQGAQKRYNSNNNNNTRSRGRRSGGQGGQGSQGGQVGQKNNNKNQGPNNSDKPELIVASVQYSADNQPVTNVKVNVSKKDISLNLKLNPDEFKQFLSVIQPFIEKNKSIDNQNVNDTKNGNNNKKISSPL